MRFAVLLLCLIAAPAIAQDDPVKRSGESRPGVAIDSRGGAVVDPTKNVLDLVTAESKYQNKAREDLDAKIQAQLQAQEEKNGLRDGHAKELAAAESRRVNEQLALRALYEDQLRIAEAKRIDAIRAVDVNAVTVATQRAAEQAATLAANVATSAEALRGLVATTATTQANSQQQVVNALSARLTTLEQAGYLSQGKSTVSDPAFAILLAKVDALSAAQTLGAGKTQGIDATWAFLIGLAVLAVAVLGLLINRRSHGS